MRLLPLEQCGDIIRADMGNLLLMSTTGRFTVAIFLVFFNHSKMHNRASRSRKISGENCNYRRRKRTKKVMKRMTKRILRQGCKRQVVWKRQVVLSPQCLPSSV